MKKLLLLSVILVFLLSGCASADISGPTPEPEPIETTPELTPEPELDISEYKAMAAQLSEHIMEISIIVSNMGKYMFNYWDALESVGGTVNYENMTEYAFEWLEENADMSKDDVLAEHADIKSQYSDFVDVNISGMLAEDIYANMSDLYSTSDALYRLVTEPSGSVDDFLLAFNLHSNSIVNTHDLLTALVS